MLPPFQVEEDVWWLYAHGPGMEVLSRCSEGETAKFMAEYVRMIGYLDEILPLQFQSRSDVPASWVLFTDEVHRTAAWKHLVAELEERQTEDARKRGVSAWSIRKVEALPNFRLGDMDSESVFAVLEKGSLPPALKPTPDYVRSRLEARTPPLPSWFVAGMRRLLLRFTMKVGSVRGEAEFGPIGSTPGFGGVTNSSSAAAKRDEPRIGRQLWMNPSLFARLLETYTNGDRSAFDEVLRSTHTQPVPLADLFLHGDRGQPFEDARRRETAVLFIRLMMTDWKREIAEWKRLEIASYGAKPQVTRGDNGGVTLESNGAPFYADRVRTKLALTGESASQLWKFVDRASCEPVTEALFRECFGLSFSEGDAAMRDALYFMFNNSIAVKPPATADVKVREATLAEVSRIKGHFNRLEVRYVRANSPTVTDEFVEQARRTLWKSYDAGDRDPRLLAELGLFECDVNEDAKAIPFLEAAAAGKVVRPCVYYELAWIRLAALWRENGTAKLTREQLATVLQPLQTAKQQSPSLPDVLIIEAEAWLHSDSVPTAEQLAEMRAGVRLFPDRLALVEAVALLHAAQGQLQAAQDLVAQDLRAVAVPAECEELTRFREALTGLQTR